MELCEGVHTSAEVRARAFFLLPFLMLDIGTTQVTRGIRDVVGLDLLFDCR